MESMKKILVLGAGSGSNPKDKNSISNAAPVDLRTTGSFSIEENAQLGTSVGYLRAQISSSIDMSNLPSKPCTASVCSVSPL